MPGETDVVIVVGGLSSAIIEELLRPFLSGVLLDPELTTSSHVLAMILRSSPAAGSACPPEGWPRCPGPSPTRCRPT